MVKIGIIGGSGLEQPEIIQEAKDAEINTPYGKPSSPLKVGKISDVNVALLSRHGREHTIPPTQVNNRANLWALKEVGCTHILATTACGSLKREIQRGNLIILDQFIDFTKQRKITFYEEFLPGKMVHTPMAEPFSKELRNILIKTCEELNLSHHKKGTVITIEGPRFSTKAESKMFSLLGADVINMSIAPEATLANELGIPYAAIAMSTDYDCLFDDIPPVTWEEIIKVFHENVGKVTNLIINSIQQINLLNGKEKITSLNHKKNEFNLKSTIRTIPNWPKLGIMFRDITTLIKDPKAFNYVIEQFAEHYQNQKIDKIAGIESRGFIFGAALAHKLNLPFVLIRNKGKLPAETVSQEYALEYGTDKIEMHKDAVSAGETVLIIDDLLATGGTASAACQLVEKLGGKVAGLGFVIDLPELKGREKLEDYPIFHLVEFEGE